MKTSAAIKSESLSAIIFDVCGYFTQNPAAAVDGISPATLAHDLGVSFATVGEADCMWFIMWVCSGMDGLLETVGAGCVRPI